MGLNSAESFILVQQRVVSVEPRFLGKEEVGTGKRGIDHSRHGCDRCLGVIPIKLDFTSIGMRREIDNP